MQAFATDRGTRRSAGSGGFTLVELMAIIVMLSIVAAVAAARLSTIGNTRAAMAAKHLLRDVTFARQHAVATGTTTWVVFDAAAETWTIGADDPGDPGPAGAIPLRDPATGSTFVETLGTGVFVDVTITSATFDAGENLGFDWLGMPLTNTATALVAQGSVVLTGGYTVIVHQNTGFAEYVSP